MLEAASATFATMFVMIDPIGLTPMFAALTAGMGQGQRIKIALTGVLVAAILLAIFAVAGDVLLQTIGVSLPAFRIAGGIMLFLLSIEMLFQKRTERREKETDDSLSDNDPSVFPLATPLIAGPGALAAIILLNAEYSSSTQDQFGVFLATLAVLVICFLCFLTAELIERLLRPTGIKVLTRLFGMLLGALAIQFILDGIGAYWIAHRGQF